MEIKVLGGHGGNALGFETTSFLIDGKLLIDAGAVAGTLTVQQQSEIDHILITHVHLDHIKDLAFICDNCFGMRTAPFEVYTHKTVRDGIKAHLLNDVVWPDFTKLPNSQNPTMTITAIESEVPFNLGKYKIIPVKVKHPLDAMGFIVDDGKSAVLFSGDTGPTDAIWNVAHQVKNLKAIFTEVSFPNKLHRLAQISDHHTADSLKEELKLMPGEIPVILTHLKPNYIDEVKAEVLALNEPRVRVLQSDGAVFNF